MRKLFGIVALLGVLGTFLVSAQIAGAEEPTPIGEPTVEESSASIPPGAVVGEISPQALSECPAHAMCGWAGGEYKGKISWWSETQLGCHNHAGNTPLYSFANNTNFVVRLGGRGSIGWGEHFTLPFAVYGEICWGPGT